MHKFLGKQRKRQLLRSLSIQTPFQKDTLWTGTGFPVLPVDPGTTARFTGQNNLGVLLRTQQKKQILLVNRLVVPGGDLPFQNRRAASQAHFF